MDKTTSAIIVFVGVVLLPFALILVFALMGIL